MIINKRTNISTLSALFFIVLVYLAGCLYAYSFYVDDAYISLRYAKNLVNSGVLSFNPGETPVEGYTNFLLVLLEALFIKAGVQNVIHIPKIINIAAGIYTILFTYLISASLIRTRVTALTFLPSLAAAISAPMIYWTTGGLETVLFTTLLLGGIYYFLASLKAENFRNCFLSDLLFFLAALCRPEGLIFWFTGYLYLLINYKRYSIRFRLKYLTVSLLFLFAYLLWKYFYFGDLLPMSYYAKTRPNSIELFMGGLRRYLSFLKINLNMLYFVMSVYAVLTAVKLKRQGLLYMSLVILIFSAYLCSLGPTVLMDMVFRIHAPILPLLYILGSFGIAVVLNQVHIRSNYKQLAILVLCVTQITVGSWTLFDIWNYHGTWGKGNLGLKKATHDWSPAARWLREKLPPESSIALGDIGIIGYFSDLKIVDTFSLVDKKIAKLRGAQFRVNNRLEYMTIEKEIAEHVFDQNPAMIYYDKYIIYSLDDRSKNYLLIKSPFKNFDIMFVRNDLTGRFEIDPQNINLYQYDTE